MTDSGLKTNADMQTSPSENIAANKSWISEALSLTFKGFIKSEREKIAEIFSLMLSRRGAATTNIEKLQAFYSKNQGNRQVFFKIFAGFSQKQVELLLDQIFAGMDTPIWIVNFAADLTDELRKNKELNQDEKSQLKALRKILQTYLYAIFNYQYLITRIFNADNTPVTILKYIAKNEGVHPASHWSAFEERLNSPDRLLMALEHFKIPNHPVVYIEIALSTGLLKRMDDVLGETRMRVDPYEADTAIFYSVNNTFKGLSGAGLGERIIVLAKKYLMTEYPNLKFFSTLSPIPGFRNYLEDIIIGGKSCYKLNREQLDSVKRNGFFPKRTINELAELLSQKSPYETEESISGFFLHVLQRKQWLRNEDIAKKMEKPLIALAKQYLLNEKRLDRETGEPLKNAIDPVANFHLSNGAYVGSLNYQANFSREGLRRSFGMMVNYIYHDKYVDHNRIAYSEGEIVDRI
ncbi:MAG: malonyl-CoA decarboxylase family protein [Candidatus Lindowbacteria bacterium]|nr:malonyl-CoA decarboxylase family protein [Candidatus Lindowbacteria bacterium]